MLEDLLGFSLAELYLHRLQELSRPQQSRLQQWVKERSSGKPLQYLLGHTDFFGLSLEVGEGVFIPRPETEILVETVLKEMARPETGKVRFLDLGTGSGAIAIALAVSHPQSEVVVTEVSDVALRTARKNAQRNGVADRIRFEACDLFPSEAGVFDAVISNPPYIPSGEIPRLATEVRGFEPWKALDGGAEGLRVIRRIIPGAKGYLVPGGLLALEVGAGQADRVVSLMREEGFEGLAVEKDLCGVERVVRGVNPKPGISE
jgi:release factor glutamine methyltransferase